MYIETLRNKLSSAERAFVQCLKRFKTKPLDGSARWASLDIVLAAKGDEYVLEEARLRTAGHKLHQIIRPYLKFKANSRALTVMDIKPLERN